MRLSTLLSAQLAISLTAGVWAADETGRAATSPAITWPDVAAKPAPSAFSDAQVAFVLAWIHEKAPECPPEAAAAAAEKFLGEVQLQNPAALDRLPGPDFPTREFESALLRAIGRQLTGASLSTIRETVALRRIEAVLATQAGSAPIPPRAAAEVVGKIKDRSPVNYRRLLEGRTEDDELLRLCRQASESDTETKKPVVAAKPKVLTAEEIVADFSRRNQTSVAAAARLRAYAIEARLVPAMGEEQQFSLYRLRPGRFRLVLRSNGAARMIVGFDGEHFWRKLPGQPAQPVPPAEIGELRHLGEFLDPLLEGEGGSFQRLEDGSADGRKYYRISVKRTDGSGYVAQIEPDKFQELGRENPDGSRIRFAERHDFAGLMIAHREETMYPDGRKGLLEITRMTANPGLVGALFTPPAEGELDWFTLERVLAGTPAAAQPAGKIP